MKPPFSLVTDPVSKDTVQCLQLLLERAQKGEVIGVVYCAMYKHRTFVVHATGEADRNPVFARGMVAALDDELGSRMTGGG